MNETTNRVQTGNGQIHLAKYATRVLTGKPWPDCKMPHRGYGRGVRYNFVADDTAIGCKMCQRSG